MTYPMMIVGRGAITPVGLSAPSTCAAVRAHISSFSESGLFHKSFTGDAAVGMDRIVHAQVPIFLPEMGYSDFDRQSKFAALAIRECAATRITNLRETALIVGIREDYRQHPHFGTEDRDWLAAIAQELGTTFHEQSRVIREGHTSVFHGLAIAQELLCNKIVRTCIVGGVDSYLNVYDIERLERGYRILGPKVSRGLVPGEGAAFIGVTTASTASTHSDADRRICVMGVGLAKEDSSATVLSDGHPVGRGLERALEAAVIDAAVPESCIDLRISDLIGELYRCDDSLLAAIRFYKTYRSHLEIWHPADCVGDIGAASGAMSLILGWAGMSRGYAAGTAMCESSSDSGDRACCIIARSHVH